ncbi:hypothetical protein Dimus_037692 [Dionaea muscipula]
MMRHGLPLGVSGSSRHHVMDPLTPPELAEKKMVAEIDQLVEENHILATSQVPLRQNLIAAEEEVQRVKAQIKSIRTESDIQIRVLLEKIAKLEADARAGMSVKNDLQQAHMEAQSLVAARQELTAEIEHATQELEKAQGDIKKLPDMLSEFDSMTLEHQKLRSAFEYQKHLNIEQVEQMRAMELELVGMAREVERLRAEIVNAEKRIQDPSLGAPAIQANGPYYDSFMRARVGGADGMIPNGSFPRGPAAGGAHLADGGTPRAMVGDYDPSSVRR